MTYVTPGTSVWKACVLLFVSGTVADHPLCCKYWCPPVKKIFCLQRKKLEPSFKKNIRFEWSVYSSIIWYLTKVSPGWDEAAESVSLFKENVWVRGVCWSPTLPFQINVKGLSVDSACKEMNNGLLDLIIVRNFYVSVAIYCCFCQHMSSWHVFYKPLHAVFIHVVCTPICKHTNPPASMLIHTNTVPAYAKHTLHTHINILFCGEVALAPMLNFLQVT